MAYGRAGAEMEATAAAGSERSITVLEEHLQALERLQEHLNRAASRAGMAADRLLGQEPPKINKDRAAGVDAAQPPIMRRLELAVMHAGELTEQIHYQLNRLERL